MIAGGRRNHGRPNIWLWSLFLAGSLWNELVRIRGEPFEGKLHNPEERAYCEGWMYHASLAVELAAKAVLVPANPLLLKRKRNRMHDLAWLVRRAGLPLDAVKKAALDRYSTWVRWTTKYPVGITPEDHAQVVLGDMGSIIPFGDNAFILFTVGQLHTMAGKGRESEPVSPRPRNGDLPR